MERTAFIILIVLALLISACALDELEPLKNPPPDNLPQVTATAITEETAPVFADFFLDEPRLLDYTEVNFRIRTSLITPETSWIDFELNNRSEVDYIYGEEFALYKYIGNTWSYVDMMSGTGWNDVGLMLPAGSVNNGSIDIGYYFGVLGEGEYKIEKILLSLDEWCMVSAEFEVVEAEEEEEK
jgi:hypothetical protein